MGPKRTSLVALEARSQPGVCGLAAKGSVDVAVPFSPLGGVVVGQLQAPPSMEAPLFLTPLPCISNFTGEVIALLAATRSVAAQAV